jgi:TolA-binding protein
LEKTTEEQIRELQQRRDQLNQRITRIKARESQKERKARTKRLIETGAILEKAIDTQFTTQVERDHLLDVLTQHSSQIREWLRPHEETPASFTPETDSAWNNSPLPPSESPNGRFF